MRDFIFTKPKLSKDKDNKKWLLRWTVTYPEDIKPDPRKEYGRTYFQQSLNLIKNLKEREKAFNDLIKVVTEELENGIDKKKPEKYKAKIVADIAKSKENNFDVLFEYYLKDKGYFNPVPKKELSAQNIKSFFNHQFKPFLEKKGLINDLSKVTKPDVLEFMNSHYHSTDPAKKWNNNTYNNRRGWIHGFFKLLIDEDKLTIENPTERIRAKESAPTKRFEVFSKEERDVLFNYFDKQGDIFTLAILKTIYYAYIRASELSRLTVGDFFMQTDQIMIKPEQAKKQVDNLPQWVFMPPQLKFVLQDYFNTYQHEGTDYIFGKGRQPSKYRMINNWQGRFRDAIVELRKLHPKLFKSPNQSPYSFKHSGVTDFVNDNADKKTSTSILRFVQSQCRHSNLTTTEKYLRKLQINIKVAEEFSYS